MLLATVLAQSTSAPTSAPAAGQPAGGIRVWDLFSQSFDIFTILLLLGSVVAVAVIVRCLIEIRRATVIPQRSLDEMRRLLRDGRIDELRTFARDDGSLIAAAVAAALSVPINPAGDRDRAAMRDAAEIAASEGCARWFRKIEPLNVLGNLGPLLGLAGTVYGMIIAFAELGSAGGQASPANLSTGIAKALFHTMLGLLLALPALTAFGFYRPIIDRLCNEALSIASDLVERLPTSDKPELNEPF